MIQSSSHFLTFLQGCLNGLESRLKRQTIFAVSILALSASAFLISMYVSIQPIVSFCWSLLIAFNLLFFPKLIACQHPVDLKKIMRKTDEGIVENMMLAIEYKNDKIKKVSRTLKFASILTLLLFLLTALIFLI